MIKFFILLLCFSLNSFLSFSQSIQGIVLDSATKQPLPYVNIYSNKFETGTITNADGQFTFENKEDKVELIFSHLSYNNKIVILNKSDSYAKVTLASKVTLLKEVVVGDAAYNIAKKAMTKFTMAESFYFGKAFYRQVTLTDEVPTEFFETFNNVSISPSGIEKFHIYQARYARIRILDDSFRFIFNNFSYLTFGFNIFSLEGRDIAKPFTPKYFDSFIYSIKSFFEDKGVKYAIIEYEPSPDLNKPSLFGDFTINTATGGLINFTASTESSLGADSIEINKAGSLQRKAPFTNHLYQWTFNFKDNLTPELNYVNVKCSLNFIFEGKLKNAKSSSTLLIFEKDSKRKKGLQEPDIKQVDITKIKASKYSPKFWKDNPIIKRTHFEEDVISYFEKSNSFGNYTK